MIVHIYEILYHNHSFPQACLMISHLNWLYVSKRIILCRLHQQTQVNQSRFLPHLHLILMQSVTESKRKCHASSDSYFNVIHTVKTFFRELKALLCTNRGLAKKDKMVAVHRSEIIGNLLRNERSRTTWTNGSIMIFNRLTELLRISIITWIRRAAGLHVACSHCH